MKELLLNDFKQAMLNKDKIAKDTITLIRSAILQVEKDEKRIVNNDDIIGIISKEIKKRKESLDSFIKANRTDSIEQTIREIDILYKYLPKQLTLEELEDIINKVISDINATSIKDMSKVMKSLQPHITGKADGKLVGTMVKETLNNI